ncbi:hypothetical protein AAG596_01090 [Citromicrobium bathyomarinum]|uniref:hypothetical protein n=1 Tax=Citromicrobium bathyomarinum TaxID=72174 RepID=UPI00315AAF6E
MGENVRYSDELFQVGKKGLRARAKDRDKGSTLFLRLDDQERIALIASILDAWLDEVDFNQAMASGALRHAWDSEPYFGGVRIGSYVTSAVETLKDATNFSMEEFIEEWGTSLMSDAEQRALNAMDFPLTVYRGGTGSVHSVASGHSWTLEREVASFYATKWPQRWGIEGEPVILAGKVGEHEAFAFLNDRSEAEILIPYPDEVQDLSPVLPVAGERLSAIAS